MIPDYQTVMLPFLECLGDLEEHSKKDVVEYVADKFRLTEEERNRPLSSGRDKILSNRVSWAATYLKKAGLIESPRRGHYKITEEGLSALAEEHEKIDSKFLERYPGYREFVGREPVVEHPGEVHIEDKTPEELMELGYQRYKEELISEILETIKNNSPAFFERLVVDVLLKMGYGGSIETAGSVTPISRDGGIDGIIKQDVLGLDSIYVQAKRWGDDNPVGAPYIDAFAGSLQRYGATKGVFITTSYFTADAKERIKEFRNTHIVLVDGKQLAEYIIEYNLGLLTQGTYEIKKLDPNYYDEDVGD